MRTLSATLLATQKSGRGTPVVVFQVRDQPIEHERLSWQEEYTAPSEGDTYNAACVAYDGSIVRVRQGGGVVSTHRAYPSGGSLVWSDPWSQRATGKSTTADVAIAAAPNSGLVWVFWVAADNSTIEGASSNDNGATWGSPQTIMSLTGTVRALAAAMTSAGSVRLVYSRDPGGADPDDVIGVIYPAGGGGWTNSERTAYTYMAISGLGASLDSDGHITILVASGPPYRLTMARFDDGAKSWFSEKVILDGGSGSNYQFKWPQVLAGPASSLPRTWYTWLEDYTGALGHRYPILCSTPRRQQLTNPVPQSPTLPVTYRMSLLLNSYDNRWYFVGARQAFRAPAYSGSPSQLVNLSTRVGRVEIEDPGQMRPSRLRIWLRNDDGALAAAGQAGTYEALKVGARMIVALGYHTSAGDEVSYPPPHWIEAIDYITSEGEAWLVVEGLDAWGYLEKLRAPWQIQFTGAVTVQEVAEYCASLVSGVLVNFNAGAMGTNIGDMTIQPGQDYAEPLRRALAIAGAYLRLGSDQSQPGGPNSCRAEIVLPDPADPATYSYGGAGQHPIVRGRYSREYQQANRYEVYGAGGAFGEALDWANLQAVNKHMLRKIIDGSLDTAAKAADLAAAALEEGQRSRFAAEIVVPMNVGQEVMDVLEVTDSKAGLANAKRRIRGYRLRLDLRRGITEQQLEMVGV